MTTVTFDKQFRPHLGADPKGYGHKSVVFIDPEGWLVATDHNILVAVPCTIESTDDEPAWTGCIQLAGFQALLKAQPKKATSATFSIDPVLHSATVGDVTVPLAAGPFPEWRRVVPDLALNPHLHPIAYGAFNPRLLLLLVDALGFEKGVPVPMHFTGPERPLVLTRNGAIGLLMPGSNQQVKRNRPEAERLTANLAARIRRARKVA